MSNRADYNQYMMRIKNLDTENDPIDIPRGVVSNTVEIRNGNYYLKPSANLVFDNKNCHKKKFLDNIEIENEKIKTSITHLDCKLT